MSKKALSVLLASTMVAGSLAGCGGKESGNGDSAEYSNKQVIIGDISETSGDVFPYWTNGGSDKSVYGMVSGLETVSVTEEGKWITNETVVESVETTDNEDGSKTWTYKIKDGLKFSDGSAITAEHYVLYFMLWGSNELQELEAGLASSTNASYLKGFEAYFKGESDTFEGVHLIDEMTFAVTVDSKWLPYYYGAALTSTNPQVMHGWLPEDVTLEETENGVKFSDNFTSQYIAETVENWRWNADVFSGPYVVDNYDQSAYAYTLKKNEHFAGTYDGTTANVETVIYKYVKSETMLDQLKTGDIDILLQCSEGSEINGGLDLVEEGGFEYCAYPRAGYGQISFKCNQGPTQFAEVRRAVAYLLNRVEFAKTFTGGHGSLVHGPYGLQQWMVEDNKDEVEALNQYSYSLESAIAELEAGGWTLDANGNPYSGEGVRYKNVDGTLMPLEINWFCSEGNPVSDLLTTMLLNNPDVAAAGMKINKTEGTFTELLTNYYDNSKENQYQMFNLATGFGNPYDQASSFEIGGGSNTCALEDQEMYDLALAMNKTEEGDDEQYSANWLAFIQHWNEELPEIPLYSNQYHDFYSSKIVGYKTDGYNVSISSAVLKINVK